MSAEQKKPYEKRSVDAGKKYESEMAEYRKVSWQIFLKIAFCIMFCMIYLKRILYIYRVFLKGENIC